MHPLPKSKLEQHCILILGRCVCFCNFRWIEIVHLVYFSYVFVWRQNILIFEWHAPLIPRFWLFILPILQKCEARPQNSYNHRYFVNKKNNNTNNTNKNNCTYILYRINWKNQTHHKNNPDTIREILCTICDTRTKPLI